MCGHNVVNNSGYYQGSPGPPTQKDKLITSGTCSHG